MGGGTEAIIKPVQDTSSGVGVEKIKGIEAIKNNLQEKAAKKGTYIVQECITQNVIIWATKQPERGHYESNSMAVKIGAGDYDLATDPCCVADKVVCSIPASLFGMDFLFAG